MGSSFSQPQHDTSRLLKAAGAGSKKDVLRLVAGNPLMAATASTRSGRTLWHAAAQHGQPDLIAAVAAHIQLLWDGQLRQGIAWSEESSDTRSQAVPESNQVLSYLVSMKDKKGRTPLVWACIRGSAQTVEVLLSLGANPRIAMPNGKMPLHYAAQHGHTRQVLQLLQWWQQQQQRSVESNSAFLDAETAHGVTPLHLAVLRCHPATVKVLVEHGASVTKTCTYPHKGPRWLTHKYDGCTALHLAAATGSKSITCLLLAAHFQGGRAGDEQDPRALRNHQGRLAVDIALGRGYRRVAEVLEPTAPLSMFMSRRELGLTPIPTLAQLAGQALQQKLLLELQLVEVKLKDASTDKAEEVDDEESDVPLPMLDESIKQDLISTIRKSLSLESNTFFTPAASFDDNSASSRLIPQHHPTSATVPSSTVMLDVLPPESVQMDASPSPSVSSPTRSSVQTERAVAASSLVELPEDLISLRRMRASRRGAVSMLGSHTSQASGSHSNLPDLLQDMPLLSPYAPSIFERPCVSAPGEVLLGTSTRVSDTSTDALQIGKGVPSCSDVPLSSTWRASGASASNLTNDLPSSLRPFADRYSGIAGTSDSTSYSHSAANSHSATGSVPAVDTPQIPLPALVGDSDEEPNLDLDEEPTCCETTKTQADLAAPPTASLLSSASNLIGGTLRKALGGGHHRSRSANGSQGGNGPLSIIASMAPLMPDSAFAGAGARPMSSPEGWAAASLADWAASTSACGAVPPVHAALLAIQVDDDEEDVCEVCMDRPQEVTVVSCQHKLCVECCRSVLKMRDMAAPLCPFCRGQIQGLQ